MQYRKFLIFACVHVLAFAAQPESELTIAPRRDSVKVTTVRDAEEIALRLGTQTAPLSDSAASELASELQREREKTSALISELLDPAKFSNPATRLGAVRALQLAAPAAPLIGKRLGASAIAETNPDVRKAVIELIRSRKDAAASAEVLRYWRESYDSEVGFNEASRAAAVAAMRDIGDKRLFQVLLHHAIIEIRTGVASAPSVDNVAIRGQQINLPIDLPGMQLMSFEGTLAIPALGSLREATGQNFGREIPKWREWLNAQPAFQK
ncbi:MAG TPA: hypothetical protein VEK08_01895 [Planctomycetota bacterium]|nr:hypothetical protein [Planctomycetota bacterium]